MNQYNPYAAPPQTPPGNVGPGAAAGPPQPWGIGEIWSLAFDRFKENGIIMVLAYLVYLIIGALPGQMPTILGSAGILSPASDAYWVVTAVSSLIGLATSSFLGVGLTRMALQVARGQTVAFGELFSGGSRFLPLLLANLLFSIIVVLGFAILIVPGVILLTGLFFTQFFVVDAELGPIEALSASWNATSGHKGNLFLCGLVAFAFAFLGILACCVGVLVAAPVVMIAAAVVYTRISGRGPALAGPPAPPGGGYGGPPGGGYGGPPGGGYGGPPGGGYGGPPGGGYGGPPGGGYGGPPGGGYGGPPGGGYGGPPGGGGGYGPPGGGGGYGPPGGGGGYGPPGGGGGGGGYGPPR